jgi:predicted RNA binding protein YcfA (HicA-like mRNA interferase family)
MSNFSSVKAKEFIRVIEKLGFYFDLQKGSHAIYKNIQGKRVVVPIHDPLFSQIKQRSQFAETQFNCSDVKIGNIANLLRGQDGYACRKKFKF